MSNERIHTATQLTLACKGAAFAILFHLCMDRRALGSRILQDRTGYDDKSVAKGLRKLTQLGYVQQVGRYDGWCLTVQGRQLALFGQGELDASETENFRLPANEIPQAETDETDETENFRLPADESERVTTSETENFRLPLQDTPEEAAKQPLETSETENFRLPISHSICSGSGSLTNSLIPKVKPPPPPQTPPKSGTAEIPRSQDLANQTTRHLADVLCKRTACPRERAEQAIAAATRYFYPPGIEVEIIRWMAYVRAKGGNLKSPGHFVAKKLAAGEEAPEFVELASEDARQVELLLAECERLELADGGGR